MFNFRLKNAKILQFVIDNAGISLLNRDPHHVSVQEFLGNPETAFKAMGNFLQSNRLNKLKGELILTPEYYRLLLMDTPPLPPEEYKLAAPWLIKDFIDYPPEQAAIDIFPVAVKAGQAGKMYVVVSPLADLIPLVNYAKAEGIIIEKINITELVFSIGMSIEPAVQALLYGNAAQRLRLLIIENQEVCWLRDLDFEWNGQILIDSDREHLGFELQRSFDYYQAEIGLVAPTQLKFLPALYEQKDLVAYLSELTTIPIVPLAESPVTSLRQLVANYLLSLDKGS